MNILHTLAFLIATAVVAVADPPKAVDPDTIKDKVSITLGQEATIDFKRDGDKLLQPAIVKGKGEKKATVRINLGVTSASPVPPPREGATRPFLHVDNDFEKTLHYRALARLRGSKEFFEITEGLEPILAGEGSNKCWEFDSLVEEVVL